MAKKIPQKKSLANNVQKLPFWNSKHFFDWAVFLFAATLFSNSIPNDYNLDDELVTRNHILTSQGISAIQEIFSSPYYQDQSGYAYEYRPIVLTTFAIEHQIFGDNPHISHFFNVLLYALCCLLLYRVLKQLFVNYSPLIAFASTMIFVAHPAHTEVVCSIKNRDEILALLFGLLTLYTALRAVRTSSYWFLLLLPILFTIALWSKVTIISFIVIIPIALILFTSARLAMIVACTVLLEVPVFFLPTLDSHFGGILSILVIMLALVISFYALLHIKQAWSWSKTTFEAMRVSFIPNESARPNTGTYNQFEFKSLFVGILPGKEVASSSAVVTVLLFTIGYLAGLISNLYLLSGVSATLLFILAFQKREDFSWWSTSAIYVCLAIGVYWFPVYSGTMYGGLVATVLAYQFFFGKRTLFIPTAFALLIILYIKVVIFAIPENLVFLAMVPLLVYRPTRWIALILTFFFLGVSVNDNFTTARALSLSHTVSYASIMKFFSGVDQRGAFDLMAFVGLIAIFFIFYFKKKINSLITVLALVAMIVFHLQHLRSDETRNIEHNAAKLILPANDSNPDKAPIAQNRHLEYVEQFISKENPLTVRLGTSLEILFQYLHKVVLPYPMAYYYGYKFITPQKLNDPIPLLSLMFYLLIFIGAIVLSYRESLISFGLLVYLSSIIVFSNYIQYVPGMMADRYLLIPSLGWVIALAAILARFFGITAHHRNISLPENSSAIKYMFLGILLFYSAISFARNMNWKDHLILYRHDIRYVNNSAQAHNLLALRLMAEANPDMSNPENMTAGQIIMVKEALIHFKDAVEIYPGFSNANFDLGRVYYALGKSDSARSAFRSALHLNPEYTENFLLGLGQLEENKQNISEALAYYQLLVDELPQKYPAYGMLSKIYYTRKDYLEAIRINKKAIAQMPLNPIPYISISRIYYAMDHKDSSKIWLQKVLEINPDNKEAQGLLQSLPK